MGFRCELCDDWLSLLSFCKLCPTCYKLRTIVKCYNAKDVLEKVQDVFLVSHAREEEEKVKDKKFYQNEEIRITKEFEEEILKLQEEQQKLDEMPKLKTIEEETPQPTLEHKEVIAELNDKSYITRNKSWERKSKK
jgi:hypothetical protein